MLCSRQSFPYTILILLMPYSPYCLFFFFNDTATTEIYTLSLHDALPIFGLFYSAVGLSPASIGYSQTTSYSTGNVTSAVDRKSTRLNSSHGYISYAVFCLKKKKTDPHEIHPITLRSSESFLQDRLLRRGA